MMPWTDCLGFCTPLGPNEPFGNPALVLYDTLRVACALLAVLHVAVTPWLVRHSADRYQVARFLGLAAWSLGVAVTELHHIGDWASWRLLVNIAGAVLIPYGSWGFWRSNRRRGT